MFCDMIATTNLLCLSFTHTATSYIYTLSLHDALPISHAPNVLATDIFRASPRGNATLNQSLPGGFPLGVAFGDTRSEEHTSELQSLTNLVCRLLLEKKNLYRCDNCWLSENFLDIVIRL